jgi:circadian clock protein KaiC
MMILGQHGLMAEGRTDVDLSYLSDSTVLMRFFEASGNVRRAISVIKSRTTQHAQTIHELQLGEGGVRIGAPLAGFEGVLTGIPNYRGATPMMDPVPDAGQ